MPHGHMHLKVPYFLKRDITELYITSSLRTFATSMVQIFIPIFFLQEGYSLAAVFTFFLAKAVLGIPFMYYAIRFAAKKGVKHAFFLSLPFMLLTVPPLLPAKIPNRAGIPQMVIRKKQLM